MSAQPVYATSRILPPAGLATFSLPMDTVRATRVPVTTTNVPTRSQVHMPPQRHEPRSALSDPQGGATCRGVDRPRCRARRRSNNMEGVLVPHTDGLDPG